MRVFFYRAIVSYDGDCMLSLAIAMRNGATPWRNRAGREIARPVISEFGGAIKIIAGGVIAYHYLPTIAGVFSAKTSRGGLKLHAILLLLITGVTAKRIVNL